MTEKVLLGCLLVICSCNTGQRLGRHPLSNTNQIPIVSASQRDSHSGELNHSISINDAVSVHMITNMDAQLPNIDAQRFVFFIKPTGSIQDLSPRWGRLYEVYPIWDAEWQDVVVPVWPDIRYDLPRPGPEIRKRRLVLRWTDKSGVIIHVRIGRVQGDDVEALARYDWDGFGSTADYACRLKLVDHEWRVVSAQLISFSDPF